MIDSREFFSEDDVPFLEQDAERLEEEHDLVGLQHLAEIMDVLRAEPRGECFRAIAAPGFGELVPRDRLLDFSPEVALGDAWVQLDAFTRDLLNRGAEVRGKLGHGPPNARGIGVYIAVAFENEMRMRVEDAFDKFFGRTPHPKATLRDLWRFLNKTSAGCGWISNVIDLRNCLVHPPTATGGRVFTAIHFNRLVCESGLTSDGKRGAFKELAVLKLKR